MGSLFRRSSGRAWQLRQRSMLLWESWIQMLRTSDHPLQLDTPLIQFARSEIEAAKMQQLIKQRSHLGLELLSKDSTININPCWPTNQHGGIIANKDGRLDPICLQNCLRIAISRSGVKKICEAVTSIERTTSIPGMRWCLRFTNGDNLKYDTIVICSSLGSNSLLEPLGYRRQLMPVLGQVLDLQLHPDQNKWSGWPKVLVINGINLIPQDTNRLLLGATLEPDKKPDKAYLERMKSLDGNAPSWLTKATVKNQWYGLRSRPVERAAPILENLEAGLILATGHYRNGILLTPATAEWVGKEVIKEKN